MNSVDTISTSFVIRSDQELPRHLAQRQPFCLGNTIMILRRPLQEVIAEDGRVVMAGAIEFHTQVNAWLLTDVCDPNELYKSELRGTHRFRCVYDPQIQRGIKATKAGPKEFLREKQINAMIEDLEADRFECPQLMWNLCAGDTTWVYAQEQKELRIYQGVATRPDSNHRHHAIIRLHRRYLRWMAQTGSEKMGNYNPDRAYGLVIYTDDFEGEAHRFCVYNFLGWRMPSTTAHYIDSKTRFPHIHSRLARELMERSAVLGAANVEILSNRLSKNSAKMITFKTLVDSVRKAFPDLNEESYPGILGYLFEFIDELSRKRPHDIAQLSVTQRQRVHETSLADEPIMWQAYFRLAAWLRDQKDENWRIRLQVFSKPYTYELRRQRITYDLFSRYNPIWVERGVLEPGKNAVPHWIHKHSSWRAAFNLLRFLAVSYQGEQGQEIRPRSLMSSKV